MTCKEHKTETERAGMRCGWMESHAWRDEQLMAHDEEVCPGYSISLPEVIEAARLMQWRNHGSLAALVEDLPLPPAAALCVDILAGAVQAVESEAMAAARKPRN